MNRTGNVKGTVLVHLKDFVVKRHGDGAWTEILEGVPPDERATLDQIILVGGWYPVAAWNRALDVYLPRKFALPGDAMGQLAKHIAERDLGMLFKMVLKIGSPEFLMARTESIWSRYFDSCALSSRETSKKKWVMNLEGPTKVDAAPSAWTCSEGICAWIESGLALTGTKAKMVQTACRFRGAPTCQYDVTW